MSRLMVPGAASLAVLALTSTAAWAQMPQCLIDFGPINLDIAEIRFADYQYLLFGLVLVIMMLKRPEGLFPSRARKAELHAEEDLGEDNPTVMGAVGEAPG